MHVSNTFKGVIETAVSKFDKYFLNRFVVILRVNKLSATEFFSCK